MLHIFAFIVRISKQTRSPFNDKMVSLRALWKKIYDQPIII